MIVGNNVSNIKEGSTHGVLPKELKWLHDLPLPSSCWCNRVGSRYFINSGPGLNDKEHNFDTLLLIRLNVKDHYEIVAGNRDEGGDYDGMQWEPMSDTDPVGQAMRLITLAKLGMI